VSATVLVRPTARPVCRAFADATRTLGVPEQVLTDNGKVFTARFGKGTGQVLFDRICRDNGIRHLLTAPRSPTTTGKVERFYKTLKREFLDGKTFGSIVEAQTALDGWVEHYNTARPSPGDRHGDAGGAVPAGGPRSARADRARRARTRAGGGRLPDVEVVTRKVSTSGTISLDTFRYLAGRWLAGETVQVVAHDRVLEISHRGVHVASHARRLRPGPTPAPRLQVRQPRRPATVGVPGGAKDRRLRELVVRRARLPGR